ncbi:MAG: DNA recombination protein RmuC [Verrucomicrobia bacterium]|jgi:DNA recombination protein RmuC|nr:DNA recombination protein RmuC [Verrucomicrobiota bacterium]
MQAIIITTLCVLVVLLIGVLIWVLLRNSGKKHDEAALSLLQNQVSSGLGQSAQQMDALRKSVSDAIGSLSQQVAGTISDSNKSIHARLDNTHQVVGDVRQQLGLLKESSRRMLEIGKDISSLEMILRPPKLRGGLGELFLADLLAQILPPNHFELQHRFKGGETVDAVIMLRLGMVPIDAKFPLENFRRVLSADSAEARKAPKRAFIKDVKGHIDAISRKYIRMDENTFDFALMYIPAENVYYETIIKDDAFGGEMSLFTYALEKRVIPVSPNSFYAYLQTIILGLQGMRIEERSREVIENLARLNKEFERFSEAFRLVGQHMDNSVKKYAEAEKRFGKVESKLQQIDGLAKGLESPAKIASGDSTSAGLANPQID